MISKMSLIIEWSYSYNILISCVLDSRRVVLLGGTRTQKD